MCIGVDVCFLYAPLRGARCVGIRSPRVAAALPALPGATLLTPLCGALAAMRHFKPGVRGGNISTRGVWGYKNGYYESLTVAANFTCVISLF
jgi:hypothetical protein